MTVESWLRRVAACPEASGLVLRGSLLLSAICPGGRQAVDVDYLGPGDFDAVACEDLLRKICAQPPAIEVARSLVIYGETKFPGLRAFVGADELQVDFGFGDPLPQPPRLVEVAGVQVLACTAETLFGWKVHGLVEHGRGHWRAKDLFDLWWMWTRLPLDRAILKVAILLAFESRQTPLACLNDFRFRQDWGQSRGGARKWRVLQPMLAQPADFMEIRQIVRQALDAILC